MPDSTTKNAFSVPDRGIQTPIVGFSTSLEYLLGGGLSLLFLCAVMAEDYLNLVFDAQIYTVLLLFVASLFGTLLYLNGKTGLAGYLTRTLQAVLTLAATGVAAAHFGPRSITQPGDPSLFVRILAYVALLALLYWAWGVWLWFYSRVWLYRACPTPDGNTGRGRSDGWRTLRHCIANFGGMVDEDGIIAKINHCARATGQLLREIFAGRVGLAILDPLFFYPDHGSSDRLMKLLGYTGHRLITPEQPVHSTEYDERRLAAYKSIITGSILAFLLLGIFQIKLPRRETPRGVMGGTGNRVSRGKVPVQREKKEEEQPEEEEQQQEQQEEVRRDSLLEMYEKELTESQEATEQSEASIAEDAGLPDAEGAGPSAAGSPKGTKVDGTYYMFRIKHRGSWDANRKGIPALMREFTKVWNIETNNFDQPVELQDLRRHSGDHFPVLLYITGTGKIGASQTGADNLRWYLENGGFVFADSSGGDFYYHFRDLLRKALPDHRMRRISHDHTIFRGRYMPWRLRSGCPIYYQHPGPNDAQGIFIDGRLAAFYSPGDLGGAWAAVGLGKRRKEVELAFRMGMNIITYAMLYGGEKGVD